MDWVDRLRQAVEAKGKHFNVAADADMSSSVLSDILRRDTTDPRIQTLIRICRAAGVTVGWVLGETGFELSDPDFERLTEIRDWADEKLEAKRQRADGSAFPALQKARPRQRRSSELPAVATLGGVTFDEDELPDREIPTEYQNQGVNAVFRTRGDSMIDAGIFDGDILFVRKTTNRHAANQRIVVCRVDGTFTLKVLDLTNGVISLVSKSGPAAKVTVNEEEQRFLLIGIVVGIARDLL
jgi:SOS-response transcriptional repressor LexA